MSNYVITNLKISRLALAAIGLATFTFADSITLTDGKTVIDKKSLSG